MSHRRNPGSDVVHVIPTNDPPPEDEDDTESPSKKKLRRPPPSAEELKIPTESGGRLYKGRHCKSGEGENCTFPHDEVASRNREKESFVVSLGGPFVKPPYWKTRICYKWDTTGFCPFGTNCHFAHGASDLHRFGGGLVEGEDKIGISAITDTKQAGQAEIVTSLVSPGVSSQRTSSAVTQKPNGVRPQRKWKGPDKISRIYGDWIDDIE